MFAQVRQLNVGSGTAYDHRSLIPRIFNTNISGNSSAIQAASGSSIFIRNSIVDGQLNTILAGGQISPGLDFQSNGSNHFTDPAVADSSAGLKVGDQLVFADELFANFRDSGLSPTGTRGSSQLEVRGGLLADNGGPTQTVALKNSPTNPALDNADPADAPLLDQRRFPRDATPDIGAFELGPTTLPPLAEGVRVPDAAINGVPRGALTLTGGAGCGDQLRR
jgi:hypothetical protein